jgi:hypothetical protein
MNEREILLNENARLRQENQRSKIELINRSSPVFAGFIDVLEATTAMAADGNPQAKALLSKLVVNLDRAREVLSSLTIVRNGS